ncbi:MAG: O-antigen ligase family protein, partial [Chitinophagaceae bacterium]
CSVFALSRASMAGYFLASYLFFLLNGKTKVLRVYHGLFIATAVVFFYFLANDEIGEFFLKTFTFENTSSLSHLLEWIDGIDAMQNNPLGLGLGESGRVSGELGTNIGGENQLIIIGVQTGVLPMLLYIIIYAITIGWSAHLFRKGQGKEQQVGIVLFILKVGLLIPVLTASVESYLYVSSVGWFLVGLLSSLRTNFVQMHRD